MIAFAQSLPIGDAVRVLLAPIPSAVKTRVLRKVTDTIADQTDATAANIYEGADGFFIDTAALVNGTPYFYRAFDFDGTAWTASPSVSVTPAATAVMTTADPLELVRERLAAGLKAEVASGALQHVNGAIPVLTAPPLFENTTWPVVTVHLRNEAPSVRAVGEFMAADSYDSVGDVWTTGEGWLADVAIDITGWSLNPDARIALRKSIKKILIGNLSVFDQAGMVQIAFTQSDLEDFESYNSPVYMINHAFTCLSPVEVSGQEGAVDDITVQVDAFTNGVLDVAA